MLYIIPAWIVSVIFAFWLGFYIRGLAKAIKAVNTAIRESTVEYEKPEEPTSTIIDPDDPVQAAMYEHKVMMERLNGTNNQDS